MLKIFFHSIAFDILKNFYKYVEYVYITKYMKQNYLSHILKNTSYQTVLEYIVNFCLYNFFVPIGITILIKHFQKCYTICFVIDSLNEPNIIFYYYNSHYYLTIHSL